MADRGGRGAEPDILVPLYFTIVTALKTPAEAGTFALPTSWQWGNFAEASNMVNYPRAP